MEKDESEKPTRPGHGGHRFRCCECSPDESRNCVNAKSSGDCVLDVLAWCAKCGQAEGELEETCPGGER